MMQDAFTLVAIAVAIARIIYLSGKCNRQALAIDCLRKANSLLMAAITKPDPRQQMVDDADYQAEVELKRASVAMAPHGTRRTH